VFPNVYIIATLKSLIELMDMKHIFLSLCCSKRDSQTMLMERGNLNKREKSSLETFNFFSYSENHEISTNEESLN
jgi:hypothetical protein